jgi:hypothetical protein
MEDEKQREAQSDYHKQTLHDAQSLSTRFPIVFALVRSHEHGRSKHLQRVYKVDPMFGEIGGSFGFVPFKPHGNSVNTMCMYAKM